MRLSLIIMVFILPVLFFACEQTTESSISNESGSQKIVLSKSLENTFEGSEIIESNLLINNEGDSGRLSFIIKAVQGETKTLVSFIAEIPIEHGVVVPGVYRFNETDIPFIGNVSYSETKPERNILSLYSYDASSMKLTITSSGEGSAVGSFSMLAANERARRFTGNSSTDIELSNGGLLGIEVGFAIYNAGQ